MNNEEPIQLSKLTEAFDLEVIKGDPALIKLYKEYLKYKIEGQKQSALIFYKDLKDKSNEVNSKPKDSGVLMPDKF